LATSFLDTSAVVKRYIGETGTAWVQALTDPLIGGQIYVARITLVETVSAITRRQKSGHLATADATTALHDFRQDFGDFSPNPTVLRRDLLWNCGPGPITIRY
jgi:hypothetical protein